MELTGEKIKRESLRRVSPERFRLQVELSIKGRKHLEKIKGIKRKQDYSEIIEAALEVYLRKLSPELKSSISLKAKVWSKAKGKCQFAGCNSHYGLEMEHLHPRGKGGDTNINNLVLLCKTHNQRSAIGTYGQKVMDKYLFT